VQPPPSDTGRPDYGIAPSGPPGGPITPPVQPPPSDTGRPDYGIAPPGPPGGPITPPVQPPPPTNPPNAGWWNWQQQQNIRRNRLINWWRNTPWRNTPMHHWKHNVPEQQEQQPLQSTNRTFPIRRNIFGR